MSSNSAVESSLHIKAGQSLSKGLILLMAIACGMTVANLYYNQPLLADIGRSFHVSDNQIGIISMLTQIGYAVGLFLFVPLGDMRERRQLLFLLLIAVSLSLVGIATAQSLIWISIASLLVGVTTVIPQMMVPLAAQLAAPSERGKVIGTVMSGLLIGILLARTVSGIVGGALGWRTMFGIAAVMMLLLAAILRLYLPKSYPESKITYRQLMLSIGQLIIKHRTLREASLIAAMLFGSFSAFWTTLVFYIEGAPYNYGSEIAGLFGLVGVAGALAAPLAGRLSDRYNTKYIVGFAILITLLSFVFFWQFGDHLWGLVIGVILLDLGVQGGQIANQSRIYSLAPEARGRLNTVYMVSTFLFGSVGSALGSYAWSLWRWNGVSAVGGCMVLIAFAVWGWHRMKERQG
ncbi:MFS transporter [Paenibacillus radicis (ex Xue et al. 2023)]|uniref:MFS transporter n=1 Tax=Paenibacillus radicis (ex Xue et al. 2023) TaxID=2972489 RepID=A0ABT1YBE8_9BACL|nr:MFS transporter [Paenibacillus radicis (ex Xue et al. 2023)]MCR8630512.1 MFS transporter [Paenibacillus radicis (ex Xue et al. 2023)]